MSYQAIGFGCQHHDIGFTSDSHRVHDVLTLSSARQVTAPVGRQHYIRPMRVLLVEDDRDISAVLGAGLREQGIRVDTAETFSKGRAQALAASYDVLILDVMLPGGSGFDLCRELAGST